MKFKVGDRVRRKGYYKISSTNEELHKKKGRVISMSGCMVNVEWDTPTKDGNTTWSIGGEKWEKLHLQSKPTHIIVWDETSGDPHQVCYSIKEAKKEAKELLEKEEVIKESVEIYEIKKMIKAVIKTSVSFKEVK